MGRGRGVGTVRLQNLLRTKPAASLLEEDNQLVQEIKTLDSDMQMLVYENYNKFIGATDTIRNMKVRPLPSARTGHAHCRRRIKWARWRRRPSGCPVILTRWLDTARTLTGGLPGDDLGCV